MWKYAKRFHEKFIHNKSKASNLRGSEAVVLRKIR